MNRSGGSTERTAVAGQGAGGGRAGRWAAPSHGEPGLGVCVQAEGPRKAFSVFLSISFGILLPGSGTVSPRSGGQGLAPPVASMT